MRRDRRFTSPSGFYPGAPDLAVEVVSPTQPLAAVAATAPEQVDEKAQAWLHAGTLLVWIVWPNTRTVVIRRPGRPPRVLQEQDVITGEEVLPGFNCTIAEFFAD